MDLDGVADELYSVAPERFVRTRADREREARAAGDRDLAARIRQLGKPTAAAWLTNQLVRARREQIGPLLELGAGLRAASATLDGAVLRDLDRQQHRLVQVLVEEARRVAGTFGRTVSEDIARGVEDTLHAALADEAAADLVGAGRLTEALHRDSGFPPSGSAPRLTLMPTGRSARSDAALRTSLTKERAARAARDEAAARKAEEERRAAELELAHRAEQRARALARDATEVRERAGAAAERAQDAVSEAASSVDRLRAELDTAVTEHVRLDGLLSEARTQLKRATRDARDADRRLRDATGERERLSPP